MVHHSVKSNVNTKGKVISAGIDGVEMFIPSISLV
mgnify:CR=1 FL=1